MQRDGSRDVAIVVLLEAPSLSCKKGLQLGVWTCTSAGWRAGCQASRREGNEVMDCAVRGHNLSVSVRLIDRYLGWHWSVSGAKMLDGASSFRAGVPVSAFWKLEDSRRCCAMMFQLSCRRPFSVERLSGNMADRRIRLPCGCLLSHIECQRRLVR